MKTLIFNGSPRKKGNTIFLINHLVKHLEGEYKIVNVYDCNIKACIDCRYCWKNIGCSIKDEMQEIYSYIQECDNIVIASPIHFTELTGQLMAVLSRLQTYFCARYLRKEVPIMKKKKGVVILTTGGNCNAEKAFSTAKVYLNTMNSKDIATLVCFGNTDDIFTENNTQTMDEIKKIALFFNKAALDAVVDR